MYDIQTEIHLRNQIEDGAEGHPNLARLALIVLNMAVWVALAYVAS